MSDGGPVRPTTRADAQRHVRQYLVNDLGLSRESVREEMRALVLEEVKRFCAGDGFKQFLRSEINLQLRAYGYEGTALRRIVAEQVAKAVLEGVTRNLVVSAALRPASAGERLISLGDEEEGR